MLFCFYAFDLEHCEQPPRHSSVRSRFRIENRREGYSAQKLADNERQSWMVYLLLTSQPVGSSSCPPVQMITKWLRPKRERSDDQPEVRPSSRVWVMINQMIKLVRPMIIQGCVQVVMSCPLSTWPDLTRWSVGHLSFLTKLCVRIWIFSGMMQQDDNMLLRSSDISGHPDKTLRWGFRYFLVWCNQWWY